MEKKIAEIEAIYSDFILPESPNYKKINELLIDTRKNYFQLNTK